MRQSVKDVFFDFTANHEGFTPFMYADTLNLVTTGVGNLIDSGPRNGFDISESAMAPAMRLPWKFKGAGWTSKNPVTTGEFANRQEIAEAWIRTKLKEEEAPGFNQGGGFRYSNLTPLTLDLDGIKSLFSVTRDRFDTVLTQRYPGFESWPADAQLALLSMAWAMGPSFNFPQFKAALDARDFQKAGELSFFKGGGGTLAERKGRNAENQQMFNSAAVVERLGADPDRLFFPGTSGGVILPSTGTIAKVGLGATAMGALGYWLWKRYG